MIAFVPGHDEAGEEHEDVSRLAVLAGAEVRQGHPLTLTWLTVIDYSDGFFDQQTRVLVDFTDDDQIRGSVALRVLARDVAEPVELSVRVQDQFRAGARRIEGYAVFVCPGSGLGSGVAPIARERHLFVPGPLANHIVVGSHHHQDRTVVQFDDRGFDQVASCPSRITDDAFGTRPAELTDLLPLYFEHHTVRVSQSASRVYTCAVGTYWCTLCRNQNDSIAVRQRYLAAITDHHTVLSFRDIQKMMNLVIRISFVGELLAKQLRSTLVIWHGPMLHAFQWVVIR